MRRLTLIVAALLALATIGPVPARFGMYIMGAMARRIRGMSQVI